MLTVTIANGGQANPNRLKGQLHGGRVHTIIAELPEY